MAPLQQHSISSRGIANNCESQLQSQQQSQPRSQQQSQMQTLMIPSGLVCTILLMKLIQTMSAGGLFLCVRLCTNMQSVSLHIECM